MPRTQEVQEMEERQRSLQQLEELKIREHGFTIQGVLAGEDMPFVYSIGLAAQGLPELILVGYNPQDVSWVIQAAAQALIAGQIVLGDQPVRFSHEDTKGVSWLIPAPASLLETHMFAARRHDQRHPRTGAGPAKVWAIALEDGKARAPWEEGSALKDIPQVQLWTPAKLPIGSHKPAPIMVSSPREIHRLARKKMGLPALPERRGIIELHQHDQGMPPLERYVASQKMYALACELERVGAQEGETLEVLELGTVSSEGPGERNKVSAAYGSVFVSFTLEGTALSSLPAIADASSLLGGPQDTAVAKAQLMRLIEATTSILGHAPWSNDARVLELARSAGIILRETDGIGWKLESSEATSRSADQRGEHQQDDPEPPSTQPGGLKA